MIGKYYHLAAGGILYIDQTKTTSPFRSRSDFDGRADFDSPPHDIHLAIFQSDASISPDDGSAKLLLAALLSFTNGQSIKPRHTIQIPPQLHRGGETFHDTGSFPYLSNKYDPHWAVVKLDEPISG